MSDSAFAALRANPTVVAALRDGVVRKAHYARVHPILGPLLLVDTYDAAYTRDWNSTHGENNKMEMAPDKARFEWLGVFSPAGSRPTPMFAPTYIDNVEVDGHFDAYMMAPEDMDFGGMQGAARLVAPCQKNWPAHATTLHAHALKWTAARNVDRGQQGQTPLAKPVLSNLVPLECHVCEDGGLLVSFRFGHGKANAFWYGDAAWHPWQIDFANNAD